MTSQELKKNFFSFFVSKGHARIKNSSVIPENDPSALFINSGMHPIVPYLMGAVHPSGKRLVNAQRAVRTGDIEEVGVTKRHQTFFEMLGEWSLGDYWKKESLTWSMEFLVEVLGLDPKRLHATVFIGNDAVGRDVEAIEIWEEIFEKYGIEPSIGDEFLARGESPRIVMLDANDNFWPKGRTVGPCGPCSEIYYDSGTGEDADSRYLEVCNNVFMSFRQFEDGHYEELPQKNIDVGWGFERILSVVQGRDEKGDIPFAFSNFETDLFISERDFVIEVFGKKYSDYENEADFRRAVRIVLDHIRASVMVIADGIIPSNKDQGYVLRRLIRRAVTFSKKYVDDSGFFEKLAEFFIESLSLNDEYTFLKDKKSEILGVLSDEVKKFEIVLKNGSKELQRVKEEVISGEVAFKMKEALGLPLEITVEIAKQQGKSVDIEKYDELMNAHQEKSRTATVGKFVGGLGDHSPESIRLHTCAHLFLAGAQKILGAHVHQKGQNITPERLRYDISYAEPISQDKLLEIENWVNDQIKKELVVDFKEMPVEEALTLGAEGVFVDKYAKLETVKVYRMYEASYRSELQDNLGRKEQYISLELCGGPHVENTREILEHGSFKIVKEESSSQGVRRIKAVIQ